MSVLVTTKKLIETRLNTLSPSLPISWESVAFTPPVDGSKYLRCNMVVSSPDDPTFGDNYYRENVAFNVYVCDKLNIGTAGALTTAESIRSLFSKKTTLEEGSVRIQILTTPYISSAVITQDRLVVPIRIELTVEKLQ